MIPSSVHPHIHASLPSHCPVTGLPIYSHSSWTYASPDGNYRLRVSFIGERIVWLQPVGYVRLKNARKGMALLEDVLFAMMPQASSFIAIDDYSALDGASLNARRFVVKTLRRERRLRSYIVYGPSSVFRMGLDLGRRFHLFPFEVVLSRDFDEAVAVAHARLAKLDMAPGSGVPHAAAGVAETMSGESRADASNDALGAYADKLLDVVGRINLEPYGIEPVFHRVPRQHVLRPVYDALYMLRDDMQAILKRHRAARDNLERQEKELTVKQALLNETHTTLNVLFAARQEERRRFEKRIKSRFHTLLEPLVDGLEKTAATDRQRDAIPLLRYVLRHIDARLPHEEALEPTPFTNRERLIAWLLTMGTSPRAIARMLGLSRRTVENHCQRMRAKAGLRGEATTLRDWLSRGAQGETGGYGGRS